MQVFIYVPGTVPATTSYILTHHGAPTVTEAILLRRRFKLRWAEALAQLYLAGKW